MRNRGHNLKNAVIAFLVPIPSILFYTSFLKHSNNNETHSLSVISPLWNWCNEHPLLLANALFFFNVNVLFWVVSQILSSHWMIDLYWTVIPVMLAHFYESHPLAKFDPWRSRAVIVLTWLWSLRLSHNYFRREKWEWGSREDWRFTDMKAQYGKHWWWVSFFAVYASQQVFLIGVCLPLYAIHSSDRPLNSWDLVAAAACLAGIATAFFADTQLHEFVTENERLVGLREPPVANLETGLWWYSRHPNYFGEQLWWWGLFVFAWGLGGGWTFVGPLANSMCLAYVTKLVEDRMVKKAYRAEAYRLYQRTTSPLIPWPKSSSFSVRPKDKDN